MLEWLENIDQKLFLFLNSKHSPFFDSLMIMISGNMVWIPFYALLLYFLYRKLELKNFIIVIPFIVATVTLTDQGSVHLFKNTIMRYRPCHNLEIGGWVNVVDGCGGHFGFISSHAANVFGITGLISLILKNKLVTFSLFFWAFLVSYSRIYLGVHYPADLAGGAVFGGGISVVMYYLFNRLQNSFTPYVAGND